jgi:hypothetical protein
MKAYHILVMIWWGQDAPRKELKRAQRDTFSVDGSKALSVT